jgi:hypothetical protein
VNKGSDPSSRATLPSPTSRSSTPQHAEPSDPLAQKGRQRSPAADAPSTASTTAGRPPIRADPGRRHASLDEAVPVHDGPLSHPDPRYRHIRQVKVPADAARDGHIVLLRLHGREEKPFRYFVLRTTQPGPPAPARWVRLWIGSYNGLGRADTTVAHAMHGGMANMHPGGRSVWKGVAYPVRLPWVVRGLTFAQLMGPETLVSNFGAVPVTEADLERDGRTGSPFFRVVGRIDVDGDPFFNPTNMELLVARKRLADEGTKRNSAWGGDGERE